MSKPVRIREIAVKAQCTTATVSLALNNNERLPERTRRRIQKIAREMGYIPNRQAKSLSLGRSGVLGVIMPMVSDPFYAAILDALVQSASERGVQLQVQFHRWAPAEEFRAIRQMAEARVDGLLHYPARMHYDDPEISEYLRTMRVPVCMLSSLGGSLKIPDFVSAVVRDYKCEMDIVAAEVEKEGYPALDILHPDFLAGKALPSRYQPLLDHPRLKVRLFSPDPEEKIRFSSGSGLSPGLNSELFTRFIDAYVVSQERAPVVLASNFQVAWRLLAAMARHKVACPDDLSIISIGHHNGGNEGTVPLTALEYDAQEMATQAFDLLLTPPTADASTIRTVSPRFVYRESAPRRRCVQ